MAKPDYNNVSSYAQISQQLRNQPVKPTTAIFGAPKQPGQLSPEGSFVDTTYLSMTPDNAGVTVQAGDTALTAPNDSVNPAVSAAKAAMGSGPSYQGGPLFGSLGTVARAGRIDGPYGVTGQNAAKAEDLEKEQRNDDYGRLTPYRTSLTPAG